MGRKVPTNENLFIHPMLSLPLFIVCLAASIAIVTSVCGFLSQKKTPDPEVAAAKEGSGNVKEAISATKGLERMESSAHPTAEGKDSTDNTSKLENDEILQGLPSSPGMPQLKATTSHNPRSSSMSIGNLKKLASTKSMKVIGNTMLFRQSRDKKIKHEDSIWKKTVILGEKCRIPDEDDEDMIIHDEKGNKIPAYYHRKTQRSLTLPQHISSIDSEAKQEPQKR